MSSSTSPLTVVITGGTSGIGYETAKLCLNNPELFECVIVTGRTESSCKEATEKLIQETNASPAKLLSHPLELSRRETIANFVKFFQGLKRPCHRLVHNAGVAYRQLEVELGVDRTFMHNHISPMDLTFLMLPYMHPEGRIVVVSSSLYTKGADAMTNILAMTNSLAPRYDGHLAYSISKTYNLWFSLALSNVLEGIWSPKGEGPNRVLSRLIGVKSVCVFPGFVPTTGLFRNQPSYLKWFMRNVLSHMPFASTVEEASMRIYYAMMADDIPSASIVAGSPPHFLEENELKPHARDAKRAFLLWNDGCEHLGLDDWKLTV